MDILYKTLLALFKKLFNYKYYYKWYLPLTTTFNLIHGRWWTIGFTSLDVHILLLSLNYPQLFTRLPVVQLMQVTRGLTDMDTRSEVLTQHRSATQIAA